MAASTTSGGVGKSGSPAAKEMMFSPAALSSRARRSMARVADSATAPTRCEMPSGGVAAGRNTLLLMATGSGSRYDIPQDLLPADGRFGCGPSKVPASAVEALAESGVRLLGTSHRQPPVKKLVQRVRRGISPLFDLPAGYEGVLGNGGATAFWDAAAFCLAERKTQHLCFGEFSAKFADCTRAAPFLEEPDVIVSEPGTSPRPVANPEVDAYCLTHNETSTGVQAPV